MTDINKINSSLPTSTKIELLNDMILALYGMVQSGKFDKDEVDDLYSQLSVSLALDRKFLRNELLGNTLSDYTDWTHFYAESGYSIWKITPTNYAYNILNQLYFDDIIFTNEGLALSDALTGFDKVFFYNGSTYTDNTTEALTENGTEFSLMDDTTDYLYVGLSSKFSGIDFKWQTVGSNNTLKIEYYNGVTWTDLTSNLHNLVDNTQNFISDGIISFDQPSDWATTTVNAIASKYWIRISSTTIPVTSAKAYLIVPANNVVSLLALSSDEFLKEQFKWCSYNGSIYITLRNTGINESEGDFFITSASSATNKQNFFIYNHTFSLDCQDSTYSGISETFIIESNISNGDLVYVVADYTLGLANCTVSTKIAVAVINDITNALLKTSGIITGVNTVGLGNIVPGDALFLSLIPGKVTKSPPESSAVFLQFIGTAISTETSSGKVDVIANINQNPSTIS